MNDCCNAVAAAPRTPASFGARKTGSAGRAQVTELDGCLDALERFMHEDQSRLPALIKAGLQHVQFETIHPFLDGNGRIGRLLVTLYLCVNGVLRKPLLYLSLFLKTHRADYYRLLQEVREHGRWEA
jgi:Fic family protein